MNSNNELNITLKQHTPIIHFQHSQDGATLRATEVKPKLDRFIVEEFPKYWKEESKRFLNAIEKIRNSIQNKLPSPYKMFISSGIDKSETEWYYFDSASVSKSKLDVEKKKVKMKLERSLGINPINVVFNSPYFANRDKYDSNKWSEIRIGKQYNGEINLKILTFDAQLKELLGKIIPIFFLFENFGTRQSKGFGSFTEATLNSEKQIESLLKRNYKIIKKRKLNLTEKSIENKMNIVNKVYKDLKNSPNKDGGNSALILRYYEEDERDTIYWEKDFTSEFAKDGTVLPHEDEYYVRAILGLANLYDYPHMEPKVVLNISDSNTNDETKIERFKSPIQFKVFSDVIYIVCNDVPREMLGHEFIFERSEEDRIGLRTPWYFDKNEFLNKLNWTNV